MESEPANVRGFHVANERNWPRVEATIKQLVLQGAPIEFLALPKNEWRDKSIRFAIQSFAVSLERLDLSFATEVGRKSLSAIIEVSLSSTIHPKPACPHDRSQ